MEGNNQNLDQEQQNNKIEEPIQEEVPHVSQVAPVPEGDEQKIEQQRQVDENEQNEQMIQKEQNNQQNKQLPHNQPNQEMQGNEEIIKQDSKKDSKQQQEGDMDIEDKKSQQKNEEVIEFLEVARHRHGEEMGNKEAFMKVFQQINQQDAMLEQEARRLQKKKSKKRNSQVKQNKPLVSTGSKRQNILKQIQPIIRKYKIMHSPCYSDTEVARLRFEGKQKVFKYIMYLAQQLKPLEDNSLSDKQSVLKQMEIQQLEKMAKTISIEIDVQFLNRLNNGNKLFACKKYKSQWRNLTSNIQDDTNIELRRKIATREWDANRLVTADEMDFYPFQKRELIMQKNKRLMNQATIEQKSVGYMNKEQDGVIYDGRQSWGSQNVIEEALKQEKKPTYKYVDESSLVLIRDLISPQQIGKMKKFLQEDLKGLAKQRLVRSITNVFANI